MIPALARGAAALLLSLVVAAPVAARASTGASPTASAPSLPFLHPLFSDGTVLQREAKVPVWGWTTPGAKVTVSLQGVSASAVADAQGKWLARLGPLPVGGPYTLEVRGPKSVTVRDVLVGDVWLCAGQSNMELGLAPVPNAGAEIAAARYPKLHYFVVPQATAAAPRATVDGRWQAVTPANVVGSDAGELSAVAYFFGRHLHQALDVPVGLIQAAWGGTVAEGWMSPQSLADLPELAAAAPRDAAATQALDRDMQAWWRANDPGSKLDAWAAPALAPTGWKPMRLPALWENAGLRGFDGVVWFRRTFVLPPSWQGRDLVWSLGPLDERDTAFVNGVAVGATQQRGIARRYRVPAATLHAGVNTLAVRVLDLGAAGGWRGMPGQLTLRPVEGREAPLPLAGTWQYRRGPALATLAPPPKDVRDLERVAVRHHAMIAPLQPYALKGVAWYQGEANVDRPEQYRVLLPRLIADWRRGFGGGEIPFLIVQLANYRPRWAQPTDSAWARVRDAQLATVRSVPHTALAVTIDLGAPRVIHPRNKQEVGRRLALAALGAVYGRTLESSGPVFRGMQREGAALRLAFDHADGGLVAKPQAPPGGFAIAGADRRFFWAQARLVGKDVVVSSPRVPQPVAVRYAWADNPEAGLYNRAGLPASPFRTDDWPPVVRRAPAAQQTSR
jgi:sialate O-acetylesterase